MASIIKTPSGTWKAIIRRVGLQPSSFLSHEMPVPTMARQHELRTIYQHTQALRGRHTSIRQANTALLPATLERIFDASIKE